MKILTVIITRGPEKGKTFFVAEESSVLIGRDEKADIKLENDTHVSRKHAIISFTAEGAAFITDLNSTNGTILNRYPVKGKMPFKEGDLVTIGYTDMKIAVKTE